MNRRAGKLWLYRNFSRLLDLRCVLEPRTMTPFKPLSAAEYHNFVRIQIDVISSMLEDAELNLLMRTIFMGHPD